MKKPYTDASYLPVYELANEYGWILIFHTGIVLRRNFDQPEDVASYRMRAFYLEEIARRFPKLTIIGAHCGNPEYEWAAEVARWNPNVFFDLSGSTLTKMSGRLDEFKKFFWWSGHEDWKATTPANDTSAFVKLVFGSDSGLNGNRRSSQPVSSDVQRLSCASQYAADDYGRDTGEHTSIVIRSESRQPKAFSRRLVLLHVLVIHNLARERL